MPSENDLEKVPRSHPRSPNVKNRYYTQNAGNRERDPKMALERSLMVIQGQPMWKIDILLKMQEIASAIRKWPWKGHSISSKVTNCEKSIIAQYHWLSLIIAQCHTISANITNSEYRSASLIISSIALQRLRTRKVLFNDRQSYWAAEHATLLRWGIQQRRWVM